MSKIDEVITLLRSIDETLKSQIVPLKAMAQQGVQPSPRPATRKRVELSVRITSSPREYGQGKGDFYDAFDGDGNAISLGVSRQRVNGRTFAIGDAIHCFADDGGENKRGVPTYWLSAIVSENQPLQQALPATEIPSQEGNDDLPF